MGGKGSGSKAKFSDPYHVTQKLKMREYRRHNPRLNKYRLRKILAKIDDIEAI